MAKTTTIRARVEPHLKTEVDEILTALGLTASETIHLLYRQIKLRRGLPFDVRLPNKLTAQTLKSSLAGKGVKHLPRRKLCTLISGCENVQPHEPIQAGRQTRGQTRS